MKVLVLTSLLMTVAAESPGFTQPIIVENTAPTAFVSIADLNLHSAAGRQTMDRRIRHAADELCFEAGKTDLDREIEERACYNAAMASARLQVRTFDRSSGIAAAATTITVGGR